MKSINKLRKSPLKFKAAVLSIFLLSGVLSVNAQAPKVTPAPLPTREVSGIVKDSTDLGVIGATVTLTSVKDTLKASTNTDGIYIFKNVKSATYTISVSSIGYKGSPVMRFKQNDAIPRIVMDPILLKEESNTLNTVVINGTPSITYKTDTVEYKASDYIVRENATVDELLKKMEGMEVGTDGTLTHQGQAVTRAKLNGKEYLGGDLANAIKNLPAEIVEKIQIVDDYGDQAARTGIKDGDPEKILNITTRTDKSVGNMVKLDGGIGNNKRYDAGVFGTRVNGNQTVGLNAKFNNTVNGVAGGGSDSGGGNSGGGGGRGQGGGQNSGNSSNNNSGGSGGTTRTGNGSFSYRDKIGKKVEINLNYGFTATNTKTLTDSYSVTPNRLNGTTFYTYGTLLSNSNNDNKSHNFKAEIEINLDSNDFLRLIPTLKYTSANTSNISDLRQTGFLHQDRMGVNRSSNTRPQIGTSIFYQHIFEKPRRNFSVQADLNKNNQEQESEQDINILYYLNDARTETRDSIVNRIIARKNLQDNYRGSLTYVEPINLNTQFELNAQINYNGYDNTATTRNIINGAASGVIDSLSNIYDYSFTQARIALNYRYGLSNTSKVRFSVGLTAVPGLLSGTKVSLGTTTNRSSFNLIPIARFDYLWSRQKKFSINYSGNAVEPTFDQIQPVRDVTNPQNQIIGNPDLQATFVHSIKASFDNYIANSKINYSVNINGSVTDKAVIQNTISIPDFVIGKDTVRINETRFLNTSGVSKLSGNYSFSKQLNDRKYNLSFSGSASYDHRISMIASQRNVNKALTLVERFGPRINPNDWFEINPNISYRYTKTENTLLVQSNTKTNTLAFNVDGKVYFLDTWLLGYSASKNYVRGISANLTSNPFVVNMYIEKELFKRRGKVTLQAFDILNQNNFVNQDISDNGTVTDTKSNALSRYFMLRFSMRLQKWTGAKPKNGNRIMRRGDGSFID